MATYRQVLQVISDAGGCISSQRLGDALWPEMIDRRPHQGGPTSRQFAASCILGKMRKKGHVRIRWRILSGEGRAYPEGWELTHLGREKLQSEAQAS